MPDLTIRRVEEKHAEQLSELWRAAFPSDPPDYIDGFFAHLPQNAVTLVGECGNKAVTMLFLLPAEARFRNRSYPVRYLYAGCTHPQYRGRGYYRELMSAAAQTIAVMGENAIYLHPADDALTATYRRLGYRTGIFGGSTVRNSEQLPMSDSVDVYMQKRDRLIGRISQNTVFWNTSDVVTRFFVTDAVARGARMYGDESCAELAFGNTVIESVTSKFLFKKDDYCLWLPIDGTPLTQLMAEHDGITGLVGD